MWRPWLQLTVKVKILDMLPYIAWLSFSGGSKHSTSKSNCVVWVGTWKHLRNAPVLVANKWGLLSPSVFVLWLLLLLLLLLHTHTHTHTHTVFLLYSSILFFVNKPMCFEMLLYPGKFLLTCPAPPLEAFSSDPPQLFILPNYTS